MNLSWGHAMADAVAHRGPDGEGFALFRDGLAQVSTSGGPCTPSSFLSSDHAYLPQEQMGMASQQGTVVLGHRRLAIVDLSPAGHQPMSYRGRRLWITYNGEIYNHVELRDELARLGHQFISRSDTEVILAAYAQWGEACLDRFNGMFAFVMVDCERRRVFAARDRFGVKPLYLWRSPAGFLAFASEIKQFGVLPGWRARINGQRAYDFLAWGLSEHTEETMFDSVKQVRGGQCMSFDMESLGPDRPLPVPRRWYALRPHPWSGDYSAACESFSELLEDAVRLRLRSDVPVGSCLSGGLDSSAIVCLAHRLLANEGARARQLTFTAYSDDARLDERPYASAVVAQTGATANYVKPEPGDLLETLHRLAWHMDEPYGSTSMYAQWRVFEAAGASGIKVMLDGQGADEALAGYPVFWGSLIAGLLREGRFVSVMREIGALNRSRASSGWLALAQALQLFLPESLRRRVREMRDGGTYAPDWLDHRRLGAKICDPFAAVAGSYRTSMTALSLAQVTTLNLPMLLHWEDRNSMAHSVEARVPYLDYRLVEFATGLPDAFKLGDAWTKRVLRDALNGLLPSAIRERRDKIGFETPEVAWMRDNSAAFRKVMARAVQASQGVIDAVHAERLITDVADGRTRQAFMPWRLIAFGTWAERFSVDCSP
ncbi:MAG: asparagine synthase (glutamine-hydrolyzing) [Burkholderiales bacterium]|nr:asparagine synthase (glutamine-hydrolyzing) [Burkholderiales bacterium]